MKYLFGLIFSIIYSSALSSDQVRHNKTLEDTVFEVGDIILVTGIEFHFSHSGITEKSKDSVMKIVDFMVKNPLLIIEISTHTDIRGNNSFNIALSKNRANSVVGFVLKNGIHEQRVISKGSGEEDLWVSKEYVESLDDRDEIEKCHQMNRRVEIKILGFLPDAFYMDGGEASYKLHDDTLSYENKKLKYTIICNQGQAYFNDRNYEQALELFIRARVLMPLESFPHHRINDCQVLINHELWIKLIAEADELFEKEMYERAMEIYESASKLKTDQLYTDEMIQKCQQHLKSP